MTCGDNEQFPKFKVKKNIFYDFVGKLLEKRMVLNMVLRCCFSVESDIDCHLRYFTELHGILRYLIIIILWHNICHINKCLWNLSYHQ